MQSNQTIGRSLKEARVEMVTFFVEDLLPGDDLDRSDEQMEIADNQVLGFFFRMESGCSKNMVDRELNANIMAWFRENKTEFFSDRGFLGMQMHNIPLSEKCFVISPVDRTGAVNNFGEHIPEIFPQEVADGFLDRPMNNAGHSPEVSL